ncbi:phosphoribosylglycinamide formyltransferase [Deltaproteobacteria bacterium TL4]
MSTQLPIAVLVSGSGTNLQAIIDAKEKDHLPVEIRVVLSNKENSFALERAKRHNLRTLYVSHKDYDSREAFDDAVHNELKSLKVEFIVLAGFMRVLSAKFVDLWKNRIINIHPSLLPAFPGIHAQKQAFEYGVKVTGCTVMFIDRGVDTGPIIIQAPVPVLSDDTEESLMERILKEEHRILPQALRWIANGEVKVEDRRVICPSFP